MRLSVQQGRDVVAIDFDANAFRQSQGVGLVRRFIDHGREAEELPFVRLFHQNLLVILIHGGDANRARYQHVGPPSRLPALIDALSQRKCLYLHLRGQNGDLVWSSRLKRGI